MSFSCLFCWTFFAAFFVGLISEELRFRTRFRHNQAITLNNFVQPRQELLTYPIEAANEVSEPEPDSIEPEEEQKTVFQQAIDALSENRVNCTKKAMAAYLELNAEEVDGIFQEMLEKGIVSKKANHHFQWKGINRDQI